jgi:hypothetical protein
VGRDLPISSQVLSAAKSLAPEGSRALHHHGAPAVKAGSLHCVQGRLFASLKDDGVGRVPTGPVNPLRVGPASVFRLRREACPGSL